MIARIPNSLFAALVALVLSLGAAGGAGAGNGPVVVELYTSQGCYSCPPADAYLGKLARQKNVIALSFHITYWDYLGWKDPYALKAATNRQKTYSRHFRRGYVYTPQMVIDGQSEVVGSRKHAVDGAIRKAERRADKFAIKFRKGHDRKLYALLPAAADKTKAGRAAVWMVLFDRSHTTEIRRGENGGKRLTYYNVVRMMKRLGTWSGEGAVIGLPVHSAGHDQRDGCAVIVQSEKTGLILGAGVMPLTASK